MRRWVPAAVGLAAAACLGGLLEVGALWPAPMPASDAWGTRVLDRHGALLAVAPAPGGVWRLPPSDSRPPAFLAQLLIAAEDRRFAVEPGVDPLAIGRAAVQWARAGHVVTGGSTLAMQLAKLLDPRPRGLRAKAIEAARALGLWWRLPRPRILELWLSLAPFGGNLVGVEAASLAYFGKPPDALDPAEAALLVAIPRRPEALRPDRHPLAARRARDRLLRLAAARGLLDGAELAGALATDVPRGRIPMPRLAPQLFAGARDPPAVRTTLDRDTEQALGAVARSVLDTLPAAVSLAAIVVDLPSRDMRAVWAGDWGDTLRAGGLDLTRAVRSPGSALKPFLYARAFADGLANPATVLADAPARFGGYAPEDFSLRFAGRVSAADALRRSLNLPAVALLQRLGPERFAAALASAGAPLILPRGAAATLPVALGGAGETLRRMMSLYAALATDGRVEPLHFEGERGPARPLLSPEAADTVAAVLTRPFPDSASDGVAWKTGTSWGERDAWAFGFDRATLVGIWIGRPDGTAMGGAAGAAADALPVLRRVLGIVGASPRLGRVAPPPRGLLAEPEADPLRLLFPMPGAVIEGGGALALKASGGQRPLHFLVDGLPLDTDAALRETRWVPPGLGFYRVSVVDARGSSVEAPIRITDVPPP